MPTLLIGDNNIEADIRTYYLNNTHACRFTALASGDLTDIYLYLDTSVASTIRFAVYNNDAVNNRPGALIYGPSTGVASVLGWVHESGLVGWTLSVGTIYWLAWSQNATGNKGRDKAGASAPSNQYMIATSVFPNPFGAPAGSAAREVSVYGEAAAAPPAVGVAGGGGFFRDPFIVELEAEIIEKAAKTALVYLIKIMIDAWSESD